MKKREVKKQQFAFALSFLPLRLFLLVVIFNVRFSLSECDDMQPDWKRERKRREKKPQRIFHSLFIWMTWRQLVSLNTLTFMMLLYVKIANEKVEKPTFFCLITLSRTISRRGKQKKSVENYKLWFLALE